MKYQEISRRYARALYESALQLGKADEVAKELELVSRAVGSSSEVQDFFQSPINSMQDQKRAMEKAISGAQISEELRVFLDLLIQNNRMALISEIFRSYQTLNDESQGLVRGQVRSARSLSEEVKGKLTETISAHINKKVIFEYEEDKSLIGGLVAHVQGLTFDDSISTHLSKMNEELNRRKDQ